MKLIGLASLSWLLTVMPSAQAGILRIVDVVVGSRADVVIHYTSPPVTPPSTFFVNDGDATTPGFLAGLFTDRHADLDDHSGAGNGNLKIYLGTPAEEATIKSVDVDYWYDDPFGPQKRSRTILRITPGTGTLASLEPFDFPTFAAVDLLALLDVDAWLASGTSLASGLAFNVVDGAWAGTNFVHFKDITGLTRPNLLTDAMIGALPDYTGAARVAGLQNISAVPEPASGALVALALMAAFGLSRRRPPPGRAAAAACG